MDLVVAGGGRCGARALARWLRPSREAGVRTIDLTEVGFVEPVGLVFLAAFAAAAIAAGDAVRVRAPADVTGGTYLARMRVGRVLEQLGVEHHLPSVRERDRQGELLELRVFDGEGEVDSLAELVHERVAPVDAGAARALHTSVVELGANVPQHSGGGRGFVAAQTFARTGEVLFAVGDAGRGLRAGLTARGAGTDVDAARMALSGVSRLGPQRGMGLRTVVGMAGRLRGDVHLVSGHAAVTATRGARHTQRSAHPVTGTLLQCRVPCG